MNTMITDAAVDGRDLEITMWPDPTPSFKVGFPKGIKIKHKPTGLTVICDHLRSQHMNRDAAIRAISAALTQLKASPEAGNPVSVEYDGPQFVELAKSHGLGEDFGHAYEYSGEMLVMPVVHVWTLVQAAIASRQPEGEAIGTVGTMPGTDGFTMACFKADDVPVGTLLYAAPPQQPEMVLDPDLYAWLSERDLCPDAHDGQIDMSEVVEALNEHERQLMQPAQVDLGQFREAVEYWKLRWASKPPMLDEANRLLALIDSQTK